MKMDLLYSREAIEIRIRELADMISRDYEGRELVAIGILKGAFIFMADLIRHLHVPCTVDFARLASYGAASASSGKVIMTKDIETSIAGRDILIIEDIIDSGITMNFIHGWFSERNPRSLKVCTFLDKRLRRKMPFEADYVGFTMDDGFVVGYGLDFDEKSRFLPDVYIVRDLD
ncbi:MAG: hypoxanthine phosphoribosyltransferase [Smithellaceae bacterium]|nr:hypoxanthine phosphoribosyltransferase [Smithellaceae bacterium]